MARNIGDDMDRRSMIAIENELTRIHGIVLPDETRHIVKRVILATSDYDFAHTLAFAPGAVAAGIEAIRAGQPIVTDATMVKAGINEKAISTYGCQVLCSINDAGTTGHARQRSITRAAAAMDAAAKLGGNPIFVISRSAQALIRLCELVREGQLAPSLIVGVPAGILQVVEAKAQVIACDVPHIITRGRKGGCDAAVAILNALAHAALGHGTR